MVPKRLRRLAGRSTSRSCDDEGAHGGQRPTTERQGRAGRGREPLPAAWLRMHVWWRDQGRCVVCGEREGVWFDYIVPVRKGGSNTEDNIRLLCEGCKRRNKGAPIRRKRHNA
jgi:HNH endonuclease